MNDCVFCKITKKELPAEVLQESDKAVIFKDIRPSAPVHYLVVTKKHVSSIKEVSHEDENMLGHLILLAKEAAEKLNLSGYRLVFNVGKDGGQIIDHLHLHLLGGWNKENGKNN